MKLPWMMLRTAQFSYSAADNLLCRRHLRALLSRVSPTYSPCRVYSVTKFPPTLTPFTNYEEDRKNYRLQVPEYYNFSRDVIDQWALREERGERGNNPALWWIDDYGGERRLNFQQISDLSKRAANVLTGPLGLSAGDRIIIMLPRLPQWWIINIGAIRAGVVLSPGTILLKSKDIKHRLIASDAKCIIVDETNVDEVDKIAKECPSLRHKVVVTEQKRTNPGWFNFDEMLEKSSDSFECENSKASDPMTIFFTSGTTGFPKMAEHSHGSYGYGHLVTARYFLDARPSDVIWNLSDTGWAKCAWSSLFGPWLHGACVFAHHTDKFDPEKTLKILQKYPVTTFCGAPTVLRLILTCDLRQYSFNNLRRSMGAGEPLNPDLKKAWEDVTGIPLYEGYGQSETTFLCGTYPCIEQRPGSMGKPAPSIDLQIVDNDGKVLPRGTDGNIAIRYKPNRPVGLFTGYVNDEARNNSVFRGDFYLTGDIAKMDEDGYVWFTGRDDDVLTTSGYRIGPFEVESALCEHPAVLESAVVGVPDETRGEIIKAFVILKPDYVNADKQNLTTELQKFVKNETAPYKYPRMIEFVESLPKTVSGKIRRVELRNKEKSQHNKS